MSRSSLWILLAVVLPAAALAAGPYKPVRTRAEVESRARGVLAGYADRQLAADGILDVTKAPYLADATGKKDATEAIRQALGDARDARLITFLPAGSYKVSGTLECVQGVVRRNHWEYGTADPVVENESYFFPCVLRGAGQGKTRIVLAPRAPGFGDPASPKPVVHFWARSETARTAPADPLKPQPNINFNQVIADLDVVLGEGNPGAVGIDHQAAQGSAIQDVSVDAAGGFAGVRKMPGSGGGIHGLTVRGGLYGIYGRGEGSLRGSQPVPIASNVTLKGQTKAAVLYDGRGPLTLVGGVVEGAGILSEGLPSEPWNGSLTIVDTVVRPRAGECAVRSRHSVYLNNVYFENAAALVCVDGRPAFKGAAKGWTHVEEYGAGARYKVPQLEQPLPDLVYLEGRAAGSEFVRVSKDPAPPPADLQARHAWPAMTPPWLDSGAVNVRRAPYNAAGDGKTDDAAAIQRAIDEHERVFLPKGEYRLSKPLVLRPRTRLVGVSNLLSALSPGDSPAFRDAANPQPLIDTVDDPKAATVLAFVNLTVPVTNPATYALRWRAGRHSVVRNVHPAASQWHPDGVAAYYPMVRVTGSGGGRWYDLTIWHWWNQGPDYRHVLVEGTSEPLSFYMLNPEHAVSTAQVEFRSARNVSVYSSKVEGSYTTFLVRGCSNIRFFGYGGVGSPWHNWPVFRFESTRDFLVANVDPQMHLGSRRGWNALVVSTDPRRWRIIEDQPAGGAAVQVYGIDSPALYRRGEARQVW